ncbi:DUF397 domain-containing protein [Actinomadura harenae]|uniref:DUF397 domain-containing protein n=1 Tax=Actinomadura harenae TaxID=2483351 RepID=A0A3M2M0G4_9ACTN|nr:DUF397 domain-containing protein [Actinomadura harenae]RMI40598.1 DUF397 domain-containing protein [Actinomadura harenae]
MTDFVWRKSSYSGTEQGECVEVADLFGAVGVRDSKAPEAGHLHLSRSALAVLFGRVEEASHE